VENTGGSTGIVNRGNVGSFISSNGGTATLVSGQTHIHVTHGLNYTPSIHEISIVWAENPTNVIADWWIDGISSTEFVLNGSDPGASNLDFGWSVRRI